MLEDDRGTTIKVIINYRDLRWKVINLKKGDKAPIFGEGAMQIDRQEEDGFSRLIVPLSAVNNIYIKEFGNVR